MDVPLALNDIGIRNGLKGYKEKSSTFSHKTVVDGLSAFLAVSNDRNGILADIIKQIASVKTRLIAVNSLTANVLLSYSLIRFTHSRSCGDLIMPHVFYY